MRNEHITYNILYTYTSVTDTWALQGSYDIWMKPPWRLEHFKTFFEILIDFIREFS